MRPEIRSHLRPKGEAQPIFSRVAILGHPLHPMLIHFPVAALMAVIATDLAFVFTADTFWARVGLWLTGTGAVGGWISGTAGLVDLITVPRIRRLVTAWCHAIFAVMLLSLATLNWLLRIDEPAAPIWPWGLYLSLLSGALIAIAGVLGGNLVFELAVGVDIDKAAQKSLGSNSD